MSDGQTTASKAQASKVYHSWVLFRKLYVPFNKLKKIINENSISLYILLGKYDRVVQVAKVKKKLDHINHLKVDVVDLGHTKLIEKYVELNS